MKKIMFYINGIGGGGAERVITNLANGFGEKGYESILVTSFVRENEYPVSECVRRISLEQDEIKQSWVKRNFSRIRKLRRLCKNESPDVLVSFMAEPNYRALLATKGLNVKNIISVRTDPVREYAGKVGYFLSRWLLPQTDGCVFQTEDAKKWFPVKLQNKSSIIFNMIKPAFFEVQHKPVSQRIVTCGRLAEKKNLPMLINAFDSIADLHPNSELYIYGDGPKYTELDSLIQSKRSAARIHLEGETNDVPGVLSTASIYVLASNFEGAPNALMEAMTVGLGCISTDCPCGGPKMLINNGENGILIPVGDEKALADSLNQLLSDEEMVRSIGDAAKRTSEDFKWDNVLNKWEQYIKSIVG